MPTGEFIARILKESLGLAEDHTTLQIVCSWCSKEMSAKDGEGESGISHGMCDDCLTKFDGDIRLSEVP